jgi:hypothetical protein
MTQQWELCVVTNCGTGLYVMVEASDTVFAVKTKIAPLAQIMWEQQRLVFDGKVPNGMMTMRDLGKPGFVFLDLVGFHTLEVHTIRYAAGTICLIPLNKDDTLHSLKTAILLHTGIRVDCQFLAEHTCGCPELTEERMMQVTRCYCIT